MLYSSSFQDFLQASDEGKIKGMQVTIPLDTVPDDWEILKKQIHISALELLGDDFYGAISIGYMTPKKRERIQGGMLDVIVYGSKNPFGGMDIHIQ